MLFELADNRSQGVDRLYTSRQCHRTTDKGPLRTYGDKLHRQRRRVGTQKHNTAKTIPVVEFLAAFFRRSKIKCHALRTVLYRVFKCRIGIETTHRHIHSSAKTAIAYIHPVFGSPFLCALSRHDESDTTCGYCREAVGIKFHSGEGPRPWRALPLRSVASGQRQKQQNGANENFHGRDRVGQSVCTSGITFTLTSAIR